MVSATQKPPKSKKSSDPESYRMTVGEHLEELRTRLVLSLLGFGVALIGCFIFCERVVVFFIAPLMNALYANHQNPQIFMTEASETFMVYVKISMICAAAIASPWMLYQFWLFVAAGLFPNERKYITGHMPLSITLLVSGMVFLYYVVLPLMLKFFLAFNLGLPVKFPPTQIETSSPGDAVKIPLLHGNPAVIKPGMIWFDADESRLKIAIGTTNETDVRVIPFGSSELVSPMITLSAYIDMVINMLLSFGLAFQMPLVVLALVRIGIFEVAQLKAMRRYVYFIISIVAGVIVPDVVGGMIALMIPLMLLFEMGLWLARDRSAPAQHGPWKQRARNWWMHISSKGKWPKLLQFVGTLLLIGLIVHALFRSKTPATLPQPASRPSATQPAATQPAWTQPTTAPATMPSGTKAAATMPVTPPSPGGAQE